MTFVELKIYYYNMYIKIHKPKNHTSNKGSCSNLIDYLEKENNDVDVMDNERFFNHDGTKISAEMAKHNLDNNKGKLGKNESKFYMLTVNPSPKELEFIGNDKDKLKVYVNNVMDQYADNFNRYYKDTGEKLQGKDLMYYAKVENSRTYAFDEKKYLVELTFNRAIAKEIRNIDKKLLKDLPKKDLNNLNITRQNLELQFKKNKDGIIIKEGNLKDGNNMHVHIVVSRYDKKKKFKLSPLANARNSKNKEVGTKENRRKVQGGFDRDKFVESCEKSFDKQFKYPRMSNEYYTFLKAEKKLRQSQFIAKRVVNPKLLINDALRKMINNDTLYKNIGFAKNPKQIPKKLISDIKQKAVENVVKNIVSVAANVNPVLKAIDIISKVGKSITSQISKGIGI